MDSASKRVKDRLYLKEWRSRNRDKVQAQNARRKQKKLDWIRKKRKVLKFRQAENQRHVEYHKRRVVKDKNYYLCHVLRSRINNTICNGKKMERLQKVSELVGAPMPEVRAYLESKFQEGMTWDNHGLYGWHIDHIIPVSKFDLTKESEQRKAFHYKNLQPLWAKDNLLKKDKVMI